MSNQPSDLDAAKAALADWNAWLAAMDGPNPGACREVAPAFRSAVGHLRVALAEIDRLTQLVADLERQLTAATAVVHLTTGSRS